MTQKQAKLDKNKILTTEARRTLFNSMMQGMNLKEAAKAANLNHGTAKVYATKFNFNDLVRQEKAIIEAKTAKQVAKKLRITREGQIRKHGKVYRAALKAKQHSAANAAIAEQSKLAGLYLQEPDEENTLTLPVSRTADAQIAYLEERRAFFVQQKDVPLGTAE